MGAARDEYVAQRLEVPTFDPCGVVFATQGDTWVGFATTSIHAIRFAASSGMPLLRTFHHPDNAFANATKRRLGFVEDRQDP